jgi:vacuolar-type H+-ATPase subunit H
MERKEILETLKATEAELQRKTEQAEHTSNEILARAQKQARKLVEDHEQQIKQEQDAMVTAARKQIDEERRHVLQQATTDADRLKKTAQVKKAQEVFIRRFKEFLHV